METRDENHDPKWMLETALGDVQAICDDVLDARDPAAALRLLAEAARSLDRAKRATLSWRKTRGRRQGSPAVARP